MGVLATEGLGLLQRKPQPRFRPQLAAAPPACSLRLHARPTSFAWTKGGPIISPPPLAVLAMFKNEARSIREWAEHYLEQGIDRLVLLDNNSNDTYRAQLAGLEEYVEVLHAPDAYAQEFYLDGLGRAYLSFWGFELALLVDVDEFAFASDPSETLSDALWRVFNHSDTTRVGQVHMLWRYFGGSGFYAQPPTVREHFTWRKLGEYPGGAGKCAVRVPLSTRFRLHRHFVADGYRTLEQEDNVGLQLNHYGIQSREYFARTKMSRSDAYHPSLEGVRTWAYYERHNWREINDTVLADRIRTARLQPKPCHPVYVLPPRPATVA